MVTKQMKKLSRLAPNWPAGLELVRTLGSEEWVRGMIDFAENNRPPMSHVAPMISEKFSEFLETNQGRQFLGIAIAGVLSEHGFTASTERARVPFPKFSTGAIFHKNQPERAATTEMNVALFEMMRGLSPDTVRDLHAVLSDLYPDTFN